MRRLVNLLGVICVILMITGLVMNNDAGITVASAGFVCGFLAYAIAMFLHYKRRFGG